MPAHLRCPRLPAPGCQKTSSPTGGKCSTSSSWPPWSGPPASRRSGTTEQPLGWFEVRCSTLSVGISPAPAATGTHNISLLRPSIVVRSDHRLGQRTRAERPSARPADNTVNTAASSSGSDREPSRFAAAPTIPRHSGFPGILADPGALRTRTVRGPGSWEQPNNVKGTL